MGIIESRSGTMNVNNRELETMLTAARMEERHGGATLMAARLESLAVHISRYQLNNVEAADLLRQEADNLRNEIQDVH